MSQDPARWSSSPGELPAEYGETLAAFRADGPSEAQLSRMLEGLESSAPGLLGLGWRGFGLVGLAGLGGAALLVAALVWPHAQESQPAARGTALSAAESVPHAAPAIEVVVDTPAELAPAVPSQVELPAAPPAALVRGAAPKQVRHRPVPALVPVATVQDPAAELALLSRARRVLAQHPSRTLALAQEHGQHYPQGTFSEERELLAIEALVALSQLPEAERRARAFRQQFTHSIHLKRVAELIGR